MVRRHLYEGRVPGMTTGSLRRRSNRLMEQGSRMDADTSVRHDPRSRPEAGISAQEALHVHSMFRLRRCLAGCVKRSAPASRRRFTLTPARRHRVVPDSDVRRRRGHSRSCAIRIMLHRPGMADSDGGICVRAKAGLEAQARLHARVIANGAAPRNHNPGTAAVVELLAGLLRSLGVTDRC